MNCHNNMKRSMTMGLESDFNLCEKLRKLRSPMSSTGVSSVEVSLEKEIFLYEILKVKAVCVRDPLKRKSSVFCGWSEN